MKILIDADGSPVRKIVVKVAEMYQVPLVIISNVHHQIDEVYGQTVIVDSGNDVADHEIVRRLTAGDLVITQDYGLAALVLGKKGHAMHQDGWLFTNNNIDRLLMQRHMASKMRRSNKRSPVIKKRTKSQDQDFEKALVDFVCSYRWK